MLPRATSVPSLAVSNSKIRLQSHPAWSAPWVAQQPVSRTQEPVLGDSSGGSQSPKNFDAELAYISTGAASATFAGISRTAFAYSGRATQNTTGFDYSALRRPSLSTGANGLFVRVGGHSLSTQVDVSLLAGSTAGVSSASTSGTGSLLGFGYDGKFADKFGCRIAYTSYNSVAGISGNDVSLLSVGFVIKF
jgi:hypothetical protein